MCGEDVGPHEPPGPRLWWHVQVFGVHHHLRQDRAMHDLLSLQNAPQQALMCGDRARQAEGHANVAAGWSHAAPYGRRPYALLGCSSVEPWYVDADAQSPILAWMWGHGR